MIYDRNPLGAVFWERVEYELEKEKWQKQHAIQDSSTLLSKDSVVYESVPLSALRKVDLDVKEGYVTERRAGKYLERRVATIQQTGGSLIRKLPHSEDFEGEVEMPYVRKKDIFPETDLTPDEIKWSISLSGDNPPQEGERPEGLRSFICIDEERRLYVEPKGLRLMKKNTSRFANPRDVKKSCENFKWLVRANEDRLRLFVTLTYARNMRDTKQLYQDYRKFWQALKRAYPSIDGYLVAFEPQKRGAWHAHMLILSPSPLLYISNRHVHALWGHGFTKTQRPRGIKDVASYLTSYLTNVKSGNETKKGARLWMYPSRFRFLRSSKTVRRTSVRRWYGPWNRLHRVQDWNLLYDYQNCRRLGTRDGTVLYNVSKILCLEDTSGMVYSGDGYD